MYAVGRRIDVRMLSGQVSKVLSLCSRHGRQIISVQLDGSFVYGRRKGKNLIERRRRPGTLKVSRKVAIHGCTLSPYPGQAVPNCRVPLVGW